MDNQNHKNTWNNFTKFVLWGTVAVIAVLVLMALFLLQCFNMKIASLSEDKSIEKRIAVTPDVAKKYIDLGIELSLPENYGSHIGIQDNVFKDLGVNIAKEESELINNSDLFIQLGLLSNEKTSQIKEGQSIIGVLNPYENKDKIEKLSKKK